MDAVIDNANSIGQTVPQDTVDKILQDGRALIATLLNQPEAEMKLVVDAMLLKKSVGKSFTEFLLYIVNLIRKVIEDKIIKMKNSVKQSTLSELSHTFLVLRHTQGHFEDETPNDDVADSVAIVVGCATKVTDVIKSLQKKHCLRWFRSAKNLSALVPIFERITEVARGVQCIECRTFSELLLDIAALQDSLVDIEKRILYADIAGISVTALFAISGLACVIVGAILFVTPVGIPLMATGAAGISTAGVIGGITMFSDRIAIKYLDCTTVKGNLKGNKFVCRKDIKELS